MFDAISSTYDKTNRWMTFGLDLYWRKKAASFLPQKGSLSVLDCATGTGDLLLSLLKHSDQIQKIEGIDLSEEMLKLASQKITKTRFASLVTLQRADILSLPFSHESFDCLTLSFGIRNVTDVPLCLREMLRVLKPKGRLIILETSLPKNRLLKFLHRFYIRKILPFIGGLLSQKKSAYQYLNETAETFPYGNDFCHLIKNAGFTTVNCHPMTFGSVSLYVAEK